MLIAALLHLKKSVDEGQDLSHLDGTADFSGSSPQDLTNQLQQLEGCICDTNYSVGDWDVTAYVDDDGHLNLFAAHIDGTEAYDVGEDIGKCNEFGARLTTKGIEEAYLSSDDT